MDKKSYVQLCFDDGNMITAQKKLLIQHSLYFEAMFSGNFMESHSKNPIKLKVLKFKCHTNPYATCIFISITN